MQLVVSREYYFSLNLLFLFTSTSSAFRLFIVCSFLMWELNIYRPRLLHIGNAHIFRLSSFSTAIMNDPCFEHSNFVYTKYESELCADPEFLSSKLNALRYNGMYISHWCESSWCPRREKTLITIISHEMSMEPVSSVHHRHHRQTTISGINDAD